MNSYNKKINNIENESERERFSSFVVDLRSLAKQKEEDFNTHENNNKIEKKYLFQKINKYFINSFNSLKNKPKKKKGISFNFSKFNEVFLFKKKKKKLSILKNLFNNFNSNNKKTRNNKLFLSNFKKPKKSNSFKNNYWRQAVKEKSRIMNSRFYSQKKKLQRTEQKVIWYRSLFSFSLILLFLVIPLKVLSYFQFLDLGSLEESVMSRSKAAVGQIVLGLDSASKLDFEEADDNFNLASKDFLQAEKDLNKIDDSLLFLASLSTDPKIKMAAESKKFIAAGQTSSLLGKNLVLASDSLFNYQEGESFIKSLENFSYYTKLAYQNSKELDHILDNINKNNLPLEYRGKFLSLKKEVSFLSANLDGFIALSDNLYKLLGKTYDKRYLLIFQNNTELRASGGFLGSYALVDVREGKIKNLEVPAGGSYDTEGGMTVQVKSPEPLWLVNPSWNFWDANWWPDWPKTSQNLMWFYEKSGGSTVDGVIGFTPTVVENLLDITGPIDMSEEYGVVITSDNFWETVQKIVEHDNLIKTHPDDVVNFKKNNEAIESQIPLYQDLENNKENKPKKIIGDLMARILEILPEKLDKDNLVKIISLFENSLSQKHIMFYFADEDLQKEAINKDIAGQVKDSKNDYLMVVNTNIAGQKTDIKMSEDVKHFSQVKDNGSIVNNVKIKRVHEGMKNRVLTGVRNVNWLRVYVPEGSRLISASGFTKPDESYFEEPDPTWLDSKFLENERNYRIDPTSGVKIYNEHGKTVFAGWVMVDPGKEANISLTYELPFNFFENSRNQLNFWQQLNKVFDNGNSVDFFNYSLLVQKQPGAKPSMLSSTLSLPNNLTILESHPDNLVGSEGWRIVDNINRDKYFSILLNNKYE